jgi:VWFA-related protein
MMFKLTAVALALAASAAFAQEPARLVRLDVVALDAAGQAVSGLTADDFQIADQNKPQKIAIFRPSGALAKPGAHEYSNRTAPSAHATAILFDFLEQSRAERLDAAKKLAASIKKLDASEPLSLYLLTPEGTLVPMGAQGDGKWRADIDKLLGDAVKKYNHERPAGMGTEDVVKKTYVALESIGKDLAPLPGRREIVWITSSAPYVMNPQIQCTADWWDCALYVPHLSVTLGSLGVTVDPYTYVSLGVDASRTMEEMAGLTGGHAYLNQDLSDVVKGIGAQSPGVYSIGYVPPAESWDNKFHRLRISSEKKGLKLQARQHYYAVADQHPLAQRQQGMMVAAYQSGTDVSDIGLRAVVSPGSAPNRIKIEVRIDPADIVAKRVTLLYSARDANRPQGEPTLGDEDVKPGEAIVKEYPIDAATQKIRLIVGDKGSDAVGSVTFPVK